MVNSGGCRDHHAEHADIASILQNVYSFGISNFSEYNGWIKDKVGSNNVYHHTGGDKCNCGKRTSSVVNSLNQSEMIIL